MNQHKSRPITVLHCSIALRIDPDPLSVLYANHGAHVAEEKICAVLEEIATHLNTLQVHRRACAFDAVGDPAKCVADAAQRVGLTEVTTAALHVTTAASQADPIALEATLSRLERGFDLAISQIWEVGQSPAG